MRCRAYPRICPVNGTSTSVEPAMSDQRGKLDFDLSQLGDDLLGQFFLSAWNGMPYVGFTTTRFSLWEWCRLRGAGQKPACTRSERPMRLLFRPKPINRSTRRRPSQSERCNRKETAGRNTLTGGGAIEEEQVMPLLRVRRNAGALPAASAETIMPKDTVGVPRTNS